MNAMVAIDFAALMAVPQELQPAATVARKGLTKRIWLLLYSEGGRWTSAELVDRLHVCGGRNRRRLFSTLREMALYRLVVRADVQTPEGIVIKYGVGKGCKVPRDVTVDEMWEVLQIGRAL